MCDTCTLTFRTNDYLQLEVAFAGKPGFEGVKMIRLRYMN